MTQALEQYDILSTWFLKLSIEPQSGISKNHGKRWTDEETALVMRLHQTGYSPEEIEQFFEYRRPLSGILTRIKKHQEPLINEIADHQAKWIHQWLLRKASSMAAKDTRLSKIKYTAKDVLPKLIECFRRFKHKRCFFCQRYLMLTTYGSCSQSTLASFDHAIPKTAILEPGNWFNLTCYMCNLAKHTLTMSQFQLFIDKVRSIANLDDHDDSDDWGQKEAALVRQKHIQWKKKYDPTGEFVGGDAPTKQQLLDLAKQKGRVDPYTGIKGQYGSNDDACQLTFGRIKKKTVNSTTGAMTIHGYYLENTQPMLLIIKYARHTFSESEIHAWIQSIRYHSSFE